MPVVVAAAPLTLLEVLTSSLNHYPKILAASESVRASEGRVTAREGAFDMNFEQRTQGRASGYYDGNVIDSKIVKPLPQWGTRLYGGYQIADGDFPIYEDDLRTDDGGEVKVGAVFSLLRDRDIDERRHALRDSRLELGQSHLEALLVRLSVQHRAMQAYFRWVAAGHALAVHRDLLRLAERRQVGLKIRVDDGDLARVYLNENLQYILKRTGRVTEGERAQQAHANNLSLYLRNEDGVPRRAVAGEMPAGWPDAGPVEARNVEAIIAATTAVRPEIGLTDADIDRARNDLALGENSLKTRVDLNFELSHDIGSGYMKSDEPESIVRLEVTIPLERRLGKGKVAESRAKIEKLSLDRRLQAEQIEVEIRNLANDLAAAERFVELATAEVEQATLLASSETERFEQGASDFFVVNLREEAAADARLREVDAHLRYLLALADFHAATMRLERFLIPDVPLDKAF
jgi:outer membrane protein TolC